MYFDILAPFSGLYTIIFWKYTENQKYLNFKISNGKHELQKLNFHLVILSENGHSIFPVAWKFNIFFECISKYPYQIVNTQFLILNGDTPLSNDFRHVRSLGTIPMVSCRKFLLSSKEQKESTLVDHLSVQMVTV